MQIGDVVHYVDEHRREFNAIVTTVWNPDYINVVYVTDDETRTDPYGRQILRATSVGRKSDSNTAGRYFE